MKVLELAGKVQRLESQKSKKLVPANDVDGTSSNDVVDKHCGKRHYLVSCV